MAGSDNFPSSRSVEDKGDFRIMILHARNLPLRVGHQLSAWENNSLPWEIISHRLGNKFAPYLRETLPQPDGFEHFRLVAPAQNPALDFLQAAELLQFQPAPTQFLDPLRMVPDSLPHELRGEG
jgi:hypothetical protein